MSVSRLWSYDSDHLTELANCIKDQVIGQLAIDGVINTEQQEQYQSTYVLIHTRPKWLTRWWSKWRKEDTWEYVVVKLDLANSARLEIREFEEVSPNHR